MISGRDILILSDDWHGSPTSTIHLCRRLVQSNRLFWFNIINRMPTLSWGDAKKVATIARRWVGPNRELTEAVTVHDQPAVPAPVVTQTPFLIPRFTRSLREVNRSCLMRAYRKIQQQHEIVDPIVLTTWPSTVDFVRDLPAATKIYYCVDEWEDYPGLNSDHFRTMELEMLDVVDGFAATSRVLETKRSEQDSRIYLPHGVDVDHFDVPLTDPIEVMESIPRPIAGFFGHVAEWVDVDLIATLARKFPDLSFVLIGGVHVDVSELESLSNVHLLGQVPYSELPQYARYFDLGMVPFVLNKLTDAVNPLKLLEYFALGIPVLASALPYLEQYGGPLYLASTPTEFIEQMQSIVDADFDGSGALQIARQHTWDNRAEQLSDYMAELVGEPRAQEVCTT